MAAIFGRLLRVLGRPILSPKQRGRVFILTWFQTYFLAPRCSANWSNCATRPDPRLSSAGESSKTISYFGGRLYNIVLPPILVYLEAPCQGSFGSPKYVLFSLFFNVPLFGGQMDGFHLVRIPNNCLNKTQLRSPPPPALSNDAAASSILRVVLRFFLRILMLSTLYTFWA